MFTYRERHGTFSWRVNNTEEVDSEGDDANMRLVALRNVEGEPSHKQEEGHQWECRQKQIPSSECINRLHGRQSEQEVDCGRRTSVIARQRRRGTLTAAETEGGKECSGDAEAGLSKDLGRIVRNNVDATELLHEHNDEGRKGSTPIARHGEELDISIVSAVKRFLSLEEYVNVCSKS